MTIIKSQKLRDFARDRDCTLRLDGCCYDPATTVLAHLPCGHKGTAMKGPDTVAVLACSVCHDLIDGRRQGYTLTAHDACRALAETHMQMLDAGLLVVAGMRRG